MSHFTSNNSTHYNAEDKDSGVSPVSWAIITIFSLTFLLGLPGNALVIWVTGVKMKRTVNTVWFLNLAIADLLCCLSLPFSIAHEALQGHWPYGGFLCKLLPAVIIFNMFASVFILVAISMDRCLLVVKPVWTQNHRTVGKATCLCLAIWFFALLMCIPVFLYRETFSEESGKTECLYNYLNIDDDIFGIYDDPSLYTSVNGLVDYPNEAPEAPEEMYDQSIPYDIIMTPSLKGVIFDGVPGHSQLARSMRGTDIPTEDLFSPSKLDGLVKISVPLIHIPYDAVPTYRLPAGILGATVNPVENAVSSAEHDPRTSNSIKGLVTSTTPTAGTPFLHFSLTSSYHFEGDLKGNVTQEDTFVARPHIITTFARFTFGFWIPLTVILICYGLILHRVGGAHFSKSRSRTWRIVSSVVSAFFICWVPYHVIGIVLLYTKRSSVLDQLDHLSQGLAYANSCINPVLYVFTGQDFKDKMRKSLHAIFENAFSEDMTRSTAPTKSKASIEGNLNATIV